jgi:hypothetical protein
LFLTSEDERKVSLQSKIADAKLTRVGNIGLFFMDEPIEKTDFNLFFYPAEKDIVIEFVHDKVHYIIKLSKMAFTFELGYMSRMVVKNDSVWLKKTVGHMSFGLHEYFSGEVKVPSKARAVLEVMRPFYNLRTCKKKERLAMFTRLYSTNYIAKRTNQLLKG